MSLTAFYIISFLGAIQGGLIASVLWIKKVAAPGRFLAAFVLLYSMGLLEPFIGDRIGKENFIVTFLSTSNFLYGPLIYLYIKSLYTEISKKQVLIHSIPFLLSFFIISLLSFINGNLELKEGTGFILFEMLIIQMLGYTISAKRKLKRNNTLILQKQKTFDETDLKWLNFFLLLLLIIYSASFIITHLTLFGWNAAGDLHRFNQVIMMLSIYILGYKFLLKPEFLLNPQGGKKMIQPLRYSRSGLTEAKASEYLTQLESYMQAHKPYLNPELSVHELSAKLGISKNHLTQVINEKLGKNFYEFLNDYRVHDVKRLMLDPHHEHLNLSALGLKAGFKSKTGFNTNFKKSTGLTPSEWKKNFSNTSEQEAG